MKQLLKILHCVTDEKFIDAMIDLTQALWEGCIHEYVFISKQSDINFKYIRNKQIIKRLYNHEIINYIQQHNVNVVIIHNLYSIPYNILINIPKNVKVVWFSWGYDIYLPTYNVLRPLINKDLYYEKTKLIIKNKNNTFKENIHILKSKILKITRYRLFKKAINRIDYFSGVIAEEYDLITADNNNRHFRAKPLNFNYNSPVNMFLEENIHNSIIAGHDIQIGNSGDPSNNHIDIMEKLNQYNLRDKQIYCPLSYSGTKYYHEKVQQYGKKIWGSRFSPLTTFIPLNEYNKIISSTRYAIFATERQQAMGNILVGLWEGRMIFLSENNPAYLSLKKKGYIIFTIQHDLYRIERNEKLLENDILINRKLLIKDYSSKSERNKAKVIIEILMN